MFPKTLFCIMNLNDFRNVVFEAKIGKMSENVQPRWAWMGWSWFQIAQVIAHLFAHMPKRFKRQTSKKLKFRCRPFAGKTKYCHVRRTKLDLKKSVKKT